MEDKQCSSDDDLSDHPHDMLYSRIGQGLVKVPSDLQYMTRLTHVNLHGNAISKLVYLDRLPNLQDLNLSSNRLSTVGTCLQRCTALRVLNLSSNHLQEVRGLGDMPNLTHLSLAHNYISCLQGLGQLHAARLQLMDLRGNHIDNIQQLSNLAGMCSLHTLLFAGPGGVHANPITHTPQYRLAVEAVLPQLHTLDGAHTTHQHSSACVLQHIAATKLASIANVASVVHDEACVNETSQKADVGDGIQDHTQASQHVHAGGGIQTSGRIQSVLAACYPGRTAQHGVHVGSGHARRWCCDVAVQASAWHVSAAAACQTEEQWDSHSALVQQIHTLEQQITTIQASHKDQCTTWQQQTQALQQQLAAAHTATAQHEAHAASLTKELQKCTEELQTQAGTHASALQNHSQQQQAVQDALDAAEREIAVQKQHAHESQVQVEALTVQVEALTAELADRAQRAQQADAQAASLRALVHALQEELTHTQQQAAETSAALQAATARAHSAQHTAEKAMHASDAAANMLRDAQQQLQSTELQLESTQEQWEQGRQDLAHNTQQLAHTAQCLVQAQQQRDQAMLDAQQAQHDTQQAQQRVEALEEELRAALEEGAAAITALQDHTTHTQQEQQRLRAALAAAHAAVVEEQAGADALAAALQQERQTVQELLQEHTRVQQQAQQCSPEELAALHASNQALQAQVQHMHELEVALQHQQTLHQQLLQQRDEAHAACHQARQDAQHAQRTWQHQMQQQQEEVEALHGALTDARDALAVKHAMLDDANNAIHMLKGQLTTAQQQVKDAQHARVQADNAARVASAKHHEALAALRQEIQAQESAIESLEAAGADALRRADTATDALDKAHRALQTYKQRATQLQGELEDVRGQLDYMRREGPDKVEEVAGRLAGVEQERDVLRGELEQCATRIASLQEAAARAEVLQQTTNVERDAAVTRATAALQRVAQVEAELREVLQAQETRRTMAQHRLVELLQCLDGDQ